MNLGGGGECPLLLIGIEPDRIDGLADLLLAQQRFAAADEFKEHWRDGYPRWTEARPVYEQLLAEAHAAISLPDEDAADDQR